MIQEAFVIILAGLQARTHVRENREKGRVGIHGMEILPK